MSELTQQELADQVDSMDAEDVARLKSDEVQALSKDQIKTLVAKMAEKTEEVIKKKKKIQKADSVILELKAAVGFGSVITFINKIFLKITNYQ